MAFFLICCLKAVLIPDNYVPYKMLQLMHYSTIDVPYMKWGLENICGQKAKIRQDK